MSSSLWLDGAVSIALLIGVTALVALVEALIPLRERGRSGKAHLGPNLALTAITFLTSLPLNVALVSALAWAEARSFGLLLALSLPSWAALAGGVAALDLATYGAHVAMHKVGFLWRFHRVHHADPMLDVTTSLRQHPGEGLFRYLALAVAALTLGVGPGAFAVYRVLSAAVGLLEHANVRVPLALDRALSLVTTFPGFHKLHHSRAVRETNSNYGNILSWWDHLFGTATPLRGAVDYGLSGYDHPAAQSTAGLLTTPFASARPEHELQRHPCER